MVLDFDPTEPIHRPADLTRLIEAVVAAENEDETDWLEWKGSGDLGTRATQFKLAKEILGFANRDPVDAARFVGGYGYLVVGAEGGACEGVMPVDVADLDAWLRRYLGDDGPYWSAQNLRHDDRTVLLIKVEPPRDGDRVFTLRHEFERNREGTIYVRKGTRAEQASSADVERLVRRASASVFPPAVGPDIEVIAVGEAVTLPEAEIRSKISEVVSGIADDIVSDAQQGNANGTATSGLDELIARMRSQVESSAGNEAWEKWVATVVEWQEPAAQAAWEHLLEWLTEADVGRVDLRVENRSDHNVASVRVTLHLQDDFLAFDDDGAPPPDIPDRPKAYVSPRSVSGGIGSLVMPHFDLPRLSPVHLPTIVAETVVDDHDDGRVDVHFNVGDLRPLETATVGPAFLFALAGGAGSSTTVSWSATSKDTGGVRTGTTALANGAEVDTSTATEIAVTDV